MTTSVNVRLSGQLEEHLKKQISEQGTYDNASEYIRELIRKDLQEKTTNNKKPFNTVEDLSTYLLKLINTDDRTEFVKFDMQKIIKSAKSKLKADI